jgi:hypothetical protein
LGDVAGQRLLGLAILDQLDAQKEPRALHETHEGKALAEAFKLAQHHFMPFVRPLDDQFTRPARMRSRRRSAPEA